jgi:sugar transferase (PEP-CTERM/EpsH1 system associated)
MGDGRDMNMKLLVLTHRLPCPPDRGAKLRAAAELRWLTARHEVWCAGFIDPPKDRQERMATVGSLAELRGRCRQLAAIPLSPTWAGLRAVAGLISGGTATETYFASRHLHDRVMEWSRRIRFDAVLAFSSGIAPLALEVPASRRILDFVDLDSRKWTESAAQASWPMRWVYRQEGARLGRREREWMSAFDACVVCTQREADLVVDDMLQRKLHVIETGASLEVESPGNSGADYTDRLPAEPIVSFLGAMDYPPNIEGAYWFADSIWPLIRQRRPDAEWWIVGRSPTRAVRELENGCDIRVTGTVPAVEPYLRKARVSIAPLRLARGVQTKVLTAMGTGRPCVVTSCVADGIGARNGHELLVADEPAGFSETVAMLLDDRRRAEAVGRAGREFVQRRYQPSKSLASLEQLLQPEHVIGGQS